MKKLLCILFLFLCVSLNIKAQVDTTGANTHSWRCGTDSAMFSLLNGPDSTYIKARMRFDSAVAGKTSSATYIIPVVFHIIATNSTTVSYSQIQWQVAELNAAFQKQMNLYTGQPYAAGTRAVNTNFEFRLACTPMPTAGTNTAAVGGNAGWTSATEPGVVRYVTTNTVVLNQGVLDPTSNNAMKAFTHPNPATFFPYANYLNIWCVPNIVSAPGQTVLGFATFPWMGYTIDGIVMRLDCIGSNYYPLGFSMFPNYDKGAVLAHEAGHYLGLYHTFQPSVGGNFNTTTYPYGSCYGFTGTYTNTASPAWADGDQIYDTPPTTINFDLGSILSFNSCNETYYPYGLLQDEKDQLENYMCYSDDDKLNSFTNDQGNRMAASTFTSTPNNRSVLVSSANLTNTGISPYGCSNYTNILTGIFNHAITAGGCNNTATIQFTNPVSTGFSATSYTWNFGDGGAAQTTTTTPTSHNYTSTTQSLYTVTCTASNGTTTAAYTTTVSTSNNVGIIGCSGTTNTVSPFYSDVCTGKEETIYIQFSTGVPSATITDGISTYTVINYKVSTNTVVTIPYLFTPAGSGTHSYSLTPFCNNGVATFNVTDCCPNIITNGDFETGNTGFSTDLQLYATGTGCGSTWWGGYDVGLVSGSTMFGGLPICSTAVGTTGKVLQVDGFYGPNTVLTSFPPAGAVQSGPCENNGLTPKVWQQTFTGLLKPSTKYFYSFKVLEDFTSGCGGINLQTSITASTASLSPISTQTFAPLSCSVSTPQLGWVVQTYTFFTAPTVTTTTSFSVTINQINNFKAWYFDFMVDNITLQAMTPAIQAITNATICPGNSTPLSVSPNCSANISDYTYSWSPATGLSSTTGSLVTASPTSTTAYTLVAVATSTVTNPQNAVSTVTVTVNPTISVTGNTNICSAGVTSTTLTANSGATTYTWSPATGLSTTSGSVVVASPTVTTTYTVSGTMGACVGSKTVTVTVNSPSTLSVTASPSFTTCAGIPTVLTASGASTYTWSSNAGSATTSTVSVSPVSSTDYTVTGTSSIGCVNTKTTTVTVNSLPSLTVTPSPSATICTSPSLTLTASGASTYTWSPNTALSTTTGSATVASPTATIVYTASGTNSSGCIGTQTITVTVNSPTITIAATPTAICVNGSSTLTASGASTYTWSPSGTLSSSTGTTVTATPTITTTYSVSGTGTNTCIGTKTVSLVVASCTVCPTCTTTLSGTLTTNPSSGGSYCINNSITVGTVTLSTSEFKIAPNVTITVAPSSTLTIDHCHLYACSGMWQGIVVPSTSQVYIKNSTLIEDAFVAISSTTSTQNQMADIEITNSVFNKNQISLKAVATNTINPPSGDTYPIYVKGGVFTSRTIPTVGTFTGTANWPNYTTVTTASTMPSPLQAPYLNSYSVTTCKNGSHPIRAIELDNVGVTSGAPSTPTYSYVTLGGDPINIFDNHGFGVYASNSNVTVTNSVFQNGYFQTHNAYYLGVGVGAYSTDYAVDNYRVEIVPQSTVTNTPLNYFYDMYTALDMNHYLQANVNYTKCYSTAASYTTGTAPTHMVGEIGFSMVTNRYHNISVDHNNMYNIGKPIIFTADAAYDYYNGSGISNGRHGGQVNITNNFIRPHIDNTYTITTQFVSLGIDAEDMLAGTGTNQTEPSSNINISNNTVDKVWNGIYVASFGLQPVNTYSNYVTLVKALNETPSPTNQYGINHSSVTTSTISTNYVNSGVSTTEQSRNITTASNSTLAVACNTETGGWRGIEFNGTQNTFPTANTYSNNTQGFVLDNSGVIGTQGSSSVAYDNQWTGTWGTTNTTPPFKTYTNGLGSTAQSSVMWIRNSGFYNPDGNGGTGAGGSVGTDNYFHTGASPTLPYVTSGKIHFCGVSVPTCANCRGAQPMTAEDSLAIINSRNLIEKVAGNLVSYSNEDSAAHRYLSNMNIYRRLRADSSSMMYSHRIRDYYARMQNSNTEKVFKIEDAFLNGNYNLAQNLASFNPANAIESNHLNFYRILRNSRQDTLSPADSSSLLALARGCPFTDGNVIYQARTLYNALNRPGFIFTDNCDKQKNTGGSRITNANSVGTKNSFDAYVYPNPNSGKELFLNLVNLDKGSVAVKLSDVEGRSVYENNCIVADGLSNFKISEIDNGVYFVTITNLNTGERVVKKLIIQY